MTKTGHPEDGFKRVRRIGASVLLVLALVLYATGLLDAFDGYWQDAWYFEPRPVDTRIVLIGIDDQALSALGQWPWPRRVVAELVGHIDKGKPKAIGLDILFAESAVGSDVLKAALEASRVVVLPVAGQFDKRSRKAQVMPGQGAYALQAQGLIVPADGLVSAAALGHINVLPDYADGVVRRIEPLIAYQNAIYPSFAQVLWQVGEGNPTKAAEDANIGTVGITGPFDDSKHAPFIDFVGKSGSFGIISAAEVVAGNVPPSYFKDAYVIVGPTALGLLEDRYLTASDRQFPMHGLEIHANILQGLLEQGTRPSAFKREAPLVLEALAIVGLMLIGGWVSSRFRALVSGLLVLVLTVGWVLGAKGAYQEGLRLVLIYPVAGIFVMVLWNQAVLFAKTAFEKRRLRHLFSQYVAPEVVTEILSMDDAAPLLESRRREVTVLFVDVRGFTPLSEHTAPEVVVQVLNAYLTLTSEAIFAERGTVDKFIGDATMAVFNAPLDVPGHAMAALRAAMAMRAAAADLAADLAARYGVDLHFGIGIHTGPAIIGNIGSPHRLDYTAIGDTVNTAARLESKAAAGEILVSADVVEMTKDQVRYTYVGEVALKGKQTPVPVYRAEEVL